MPCEQTRIVSGAPSVVASSAAGMSKPYQPINVITRPDSNISHIAAYRNAYTPASNRVTPATTPVAFSTVDSFTSPLPSSTSLPLLCRVRRSHAHFAPTTCFVSESTRNTLRREWQPAPPKPVESRQPPTLIYSQPYTIPTLRIAGSKRPLG